MNVIIIVLRLPSKKSLRTGSIHTTCGDAELSVATVVFADLAGSTGFIRAGRGLAAWTRLLLDRYFTDSYLRESLRIRRETAGRQR